MLSPHAYTLRAQSRLAISLSWVAGYVNVIALMAFAYTVSHQTGNVTAFARLLIQPGEGVGLAAWNYAIIVGTFFLGAAASGLMTEYADRRGFSSRYTGPIAGEAVLLALLSILLNQWMAGHGVPSANRWPPLPMILLASFAMGLQNGTITKISGAVVRTTHLTGVVTDLGLEVAQLLTWLTAQRGKLMHPHRSGARLLRAAARQNSARRILLLLSIFGSFLFGALAGAILFRLIPRQALLLPVGFLLAMLILTLNTRLAPVTQVDRLGDPELLQLGLTPAMIPETLGICRIGGHAPDGFGSARQTDHGSLQAPNFLMWARRLPDDWRAIVLACSPHVRWNAEAMADLAAAVTFLATTDRRLILADVTPRQFQLMKQTGLLRLIGRGNICTDLEFAIARGIEAVVVE